MADFDKEEAERVFTQCLDLGITTFEFSAAGKNDRIHKVFFDTIAKNDFDRKDLVILARLGKEINEDGIEIIDQSRSALIRQLDTFLKKSGKEYSQGDFLGNRDYHQFIPAGQSQLLYHCRV